MPADLRERIAVTVSQKSLGELQNAVYGGMMELSGTTFLCTSGWTVGYQLRGSWLATGVVTAGHCDGIDTIYEPFVGTHNFPWQQGFIGSWGDFERHSSPDVPALDDFWASSTSVRDVATVEAYANISIGETVCVYSPQQATRFCGRQVDYVNVVWGSVGHLVHMNGADTLNGDSGGGWSWNNTAYGVHRGVGTVGSTFGGVFSAATYTDEALGPYVYVVY